MEERSADEDRKGEDGQKRKVIMKREKRMEVRGEGEALRKWHL